jgi:L-ascorbate metabolism protein UlaG (beta-lactamase superfamily)
VKLIERQKVLPIHYDTFDIIKQDPTVWKDRVEQETSAKVTVLKPGEYVEL